MFKNMFTTASEGARRSAFLTPKLVIRRNEQVKRRFPTTLAEDSGGGVHVTPQGSLSAGMSTPKAVCVTVGVGGLLDGRQGQYAVLPAQPVPEGIPKPPYACSQDGRSDDLRSSEEEKPGEVQTSEAIEKIKAACVVAANALKLGLRAAQEGATTEDLDRVVHEYIVSVGAYPAAVNFHNFPKAVCASVNEAVCHGIPNLRPLQSGDIITLDCTAYVDGYFGEDSKTGDCAGTAMIGDVLPTHRKLVVTTQACLEEAIKVVQPGVPISEVGRCIHTLATGRGFSVVREFCGHFIGRRMHLPPLISHVYRAPDTTPIATKLCHFRRLCCLLPANDTEGVFRSGQTLTIEPILCEGAADLYTWRDGWTIVTQDGGRAAQFEHTLLVTEKGAEVLTLPTV
ncbi:methionine type i [Cystoisospora suis]|uniref:Methionine aminopeptidase n=1 Tax=Cystoisospora suis TaxID=483139 RepID=A0A2C6KS88_9APIC|nr:methionine type i [Cystoisospora suis]